MASDENQGHLSGGYDHIPIGPLVNNRPKPTKNRQGKGGHLPIQSSDSNPRILTREAKQIFEKALARQRIVPDDRIYFKVVFANDIGFPNVKAAVEDMRGEIVRVIDDLTAILAIRKKDYGSLIVALRKHANAVSTVTETMLSDKVHEAVLIQTLLREPERRLGVTMQMFDATGLKDTDQTETAIRRFLSPYEGTIEETYLSRNWALYSVHAGAGEIRQIAESIETIERVEEIPQITLVPAVRRQTEVSYASAVALVEQAQTELPKVCVIDSGINKTHPSLVGYIEDTFDFTTESKGPCTDVDKHGSLVAGIVVHGGNMATHQQPVAKVIMVKGFENDRTARNMSLIKLIRESMVVARNKTKVFNLSFGTKGPNDGYTQTLNQLIYENNLVVVASAGNIPVDFIKTHLNRGEKYPDYLKDHFIFFPGDVDNAITVGSYAAKPSAQFRGRAPSPFTPVGHDPLRIKPDLLEEGGNLNAIKQGETVVSMNCSSVGVESASPNSPLKTESAGTSFASPAVASLASRIIDRYPQASPFLVKAIILSSCERLSEGNTKMFDYMIQGYGVPEGLNAMGSADWRACYIMQGDFLGLNQLEFHEYEFLVPDNASRVQAVLVVGKPLRSQGYLRLRLYPTGLKATTVPKPSALEKIGPSILRWKVSTTYREVIPVHRGRKGAWTMKIFPHFDRVLGTEPSLRYGCVVCVESLEHRSVYHPIASWLEKKKRLAEAQAKAEQPKAEKTRAEVVLHQP